MRARVLLQAVLGEIVLVAYLFAVTYWHPYIARADNLLAMGSLFGEGLCMRRVWACILIESDMER